jgi:hypothetical protein
MKTMRNWMLGAAVVAGTMGLAAVPAQAAEFGVYVRGPVAYVPPCPGAGYEWVAGYQASGYWVPGRWNFVGARGAARWDGDRFRDGGFDRDRHFDRDRGRDFDRGHERFRR